MPLALTSMSIASFIFTGSASFSVVLGQKVSEDGSLIIFQRVFPKTINLSPDIPHVSQIYCVRFYELAMHAVNYLVETRNPFLNCITILVVLKICSRINLLVNQL